MLTSLIAAYVAGLVLIAAAEAYALLQRVDHGTFSEWAQRTFAVIYFMGLLGGHVVLAPKAGVFGWQASVVVIVFGLLLSLLTTWQTADWKPWESPNTFRILRVAVFVVGLVCGAVAWPLP